LPSSFMVTIHVPYNSFPSLVRHDATTCQS
jgi:hypothetical protein